MTVDQSPSLARSNRMLALDVVRGFAMLLMLISHSSWWLDDLDYGVAYGWDNMIAPNLRAPESIMGFVLQLATPAFFLLGGFSIVLIILDPAVMNLQINPPYYSEHMSVLTGMGICVCVMAWLRRLDWRGMVALALVVLLGTQFYYHSLTVAGEWPREESVLRAVLLAPSVEDMTWKTQFPALPWLPIVLLGFITATLVIRKGMSLGKLSLWLGLGGLALFAANMLIGDLWTLYPANPFIFGKHPPDFAYLSLYTTVCSTSP